MIEAVIFDIDGTLYDYKKTNKKAMVALTAYATAKLGLSEDDFLQAYEWGRKRTKKLVTRQAAAYSRLLYAQHALEYLGINPLSCAVEMADIYWQTFIASMESFAGVKELFQKLNSQGRKIAICTDMTSAIQHRKLRQLGVADFVDVLVTSEEAGADKPSPIIFKLLLEKLDVNAKSALMIGDNKERDVQGSEDAGIQGVWFTELPYDGLCISNYTDGNVEKLCGL